MSSLAGSYILSGWNCLYDPPPRRGAALYLYWEIKFVFHSINWLPPSWIKCPYCKLLYLGLHVGHLIQGRSNKVLQRNQNYCLANECCNIQFFSENLFIIKSRVCNHEDSRKKIIEKKHSWVLFIGQVVLHKMYLFYKFKSKFISMKLFF